MPAYKQTKRSKRYTTTPRRGLAGPRMRAPRLRAPAYLPPLFYTGDLSNDFTATNPQSRTLTDIAAGDATFQRDGRVIAVTNIRGQLIMPSGQDMRIVVYIPKIAGGTLLLASREDAVDPAAYTVLYDSYFHSASSAGTRERRFNINLGRNGHRIEFDGTNGSDNVTPEIKFYCEGSGAGTSTGHFITTFYDM